MASLDAFPTNVVVYDEPPPRESSGGSTITEVLVINSEGRSDGRTQDPLEATLRDLTVPIPEDTDAEVLDPFSLPRIDQVIDSTAGCDLLSFLDAYSGYHQIKLNPADRLKTAFITPFRAFCYLTMMFSLRNDGATFRRCMQKCLLKQLGRNAHVYVDDVVVKTEKCGTLLEDLKETFENLG